MRASAYLSAVITKRRFKMTNVSPRAPFGVQLIQHLTSKLCPRLRFNRLRCYQVSVLVLTYIAYMTYHLTRKPLSVVKSVLHRNCSALTPPPGTDPADDTWCDWAPFNTADANTLLGTLDSAFLFSYAAAMFVSGLVAERVDLRYFLSLGMLVSGVFCYLFGVARTAGVHHMAYFLLVQAGAGVAQTTGWPGAVAVVGKWFGSSKKGLIFGIWNSHTSLGNILGTLLAARYVEGDWALSFVWPGLAMAAAGALVWAFLVPDPSHVGLQVESPRAPRRALPEDDTEVLVGDQSASLRSNRHSTNTAQQDSDEPDEHTGLLSSRSSQTSAISLSRALKIPGVVEFSLSLFFAKLVSYTFLFWLPLYINATTSLGARSSGTLSTVFDVGGAAGAVLAGAAADHSRAPAAVCCAFYVLQAPMLFVYQAFGAQSYALNAALLFITGALVNAPYALITTAVSSELGTHSSLMGNSAALATVTAIIDGTGSVGAAIGPMLAGVVSSAGSWSRVFYMLIACDALALLLLLRMTKLELQKSLQERRQPARGVRVE